VTVLNLARCGNCNTSCRIVREPGISQRCPHCAEYLHGLAPDRTGRVWALLLAAAILYLPANLLPIFEMDLLGQSSGVTILEGIAELFDSGMWAVGALVFFASILVPLAKILGLSALLIGIRLGANRARLGRTRFYRVIEAIGPWSMIDVFVVSLMISLVQFGELASFRPGPGAACFAVVVILTLLAARSFDPRELWKTAEEKI